MARGARESKVVEETGLLDEALLQRKRAEEALRVKDSAIASSINAIALADLEGNLTYVNPSFLKLWGYDDNEVLGKPAVEFWQVKEKAAEVVDALRDRGSWIGELVAKRKDGSLFDAHLSTSMVTDEVGKPICMMASFVDITESKRAEEALRESEARYKELADSIADVFFAMDQDLKYTYWNKASEDLTGISAKDALGKSLYDLFPDTPQTRRAEKVYLEVLRTQQPQTFINEYQLGGKDFVFEISAYPTRDGLSVFVKDITERKRAEGEIRRRSEELTVLNNIGMAVTGTLDLQEVLQTIQKRTRELLGEKYGPVFALFNERDQTLEVTLTHVQEDVVRRVDKLIGMKFDELSIPLSSLKPALREALLAGKPYVINDVRDFFIRGRSRKLFKGAQIAMGVKGLVALPLWARGRLTGTMLLFSQRGKIPEGEIELLSGIANQAAVAIENARLYEAEQRRTEELAMLNEIGRAVGSVM